MAPLITFELCKEFKNYAKNSQSKGKVVVTFPCISTLNLEKYFNKLPLESHFLSVLCILCSFMSQITFPTLADFSLPSVSSFSFRWSTS